MFEWFKHVLIFMFIFYLYILFGEISVQVFCLFFNELLIVSWVMPSMLYLKSRHHMYGYAFHVVFKSCHHWSTPQPQPYQIWAVSVTHTTSQGNAGSLNHRAKLGIEPASSWMLVRFVSTESQWELQCTTSSYSMPLLMDIRLFPCLGYCKQSYNGHWHMHIFSNYGFLKHNTSFVCEILKDTNELL